jgi:hypothetical protein
MAYTEVPAFVDGERLTLHDMNTFLHDNLEALRNPPTAVYITNGRSTNYSTSSTSFVDVDSTNMALTITTTGTPGGGVSAVFIGFCGTVYGAAQIYFRVLEDGNAIGEDDGIVVVDAITLGSGVRPVSFLYPINTDAGEHTYKLQWRVASGTGELMAHVGTSGRDCVAQFWVRELT